MSIRPDLHLQPVNLLLPFIRSFSEQDEKEYEVYYYRGDHLGSASWITNQNATPIQYLHYAPYGELIANQQATGYDERFKFTGKERDAESGYDYFGARFLWSTIGIWLSVDPLADKYIHVTPYLYCGGNPLTFIDPKGLYKVNLVDVMEEIPDHPEIATQQEAQEWLDSHDPSNLSSICYIAFHFEESASQEKIQEAADMVNDAIVQWKSAYASLNGDDGGQKQVVLQACYGAQVAELVADDNPGIVVMGATGQLQTERVYYFSTGTDQTAYRRMTSKTINTKNRESWSFLGIKVPAINGSWVSYKSNATRHPSVVIDIQTSAEPIIKRKK